MTTAAGPAALTPIGRQLQAAISLKLTPSTGPTYRRLTLEARPHINQSLRQASYSSSVADELTRAEGLLTIQEVPKLTQSAVMEPGGRHDLPGKQQTVAFPPTVILTKFTLKSGSGKSRKETNVAARPHAKDLSNPVLTPTSESELQSKSEGGEAASLEEHAGGKHRQEVNVATRPHEEPRQAIEPSPRHLSPPNLDLTATSESESESEGTEEQAAGEHRQEINAGARTHGEGQLCQALDLSLRCPGLLHPSLTTTSEVESESESEGAMAALSEEQEAGVYRQEVDVAARPHEGGELYQALDPSLRCPGLFYPGLTTTSETESESESEGAEAALPEEHIALLVKVVLVSSLALLGKQAGGGHRQEVDGAARSQEEEVLCQAIEPPLHHLSLPDFDLTATSGSELKSEATEAGLSEEQVAGECRR